MAERRELRSRVTPLAFQHTAFSSHEELIGKRGNALRTQHVPLWNARTEHEAFRRGNGGSDALEECQTDGPPPPPITSLRTASGRGGNAQSHSKPNVTGRLLDLHPPSHTPLCPQEQPLPPGDGCPAQRAYIQPPAAAPAHMCVAARYEHNLCEVVECVCVCLVGGGVGRVPM